VSPEIGYMKSVFYAKRCKDTTFFDRLANKKTQPNIRTIVVLSLTHSLDALFINSNHPQ